MIKQIAALAFLIGTLPAPAEDYVLGPDSHRQANVPQGKVTKYEWTSKIYPGLCAIIGVYLASLISIQYHSIN